MLPALPSVPSDLAILQHWFGFAGVLIVLASIVFGWRRMNREDAAARQQPNPIAHPLANMPQYYMDGPIVKAFEMLNDIIDRLKRIEKKIEDWSEPEDDRRRRR